jgi:AraC family transcriptional regulator
MYFTQLPDNTMPGFDEQLHFSKFKQHNIIFNALSSQIHCDEHVGCLSIKTVLSGEEWYGIDNHRIAVRPGQFLILNDDQTYSCQINKGERTRVLSVFFKKEFASSVFRDTFHGEATLLDDPFDKGNDTLEFFQTLNNIEPEFQLQLSSLITHLDTQDYDNNSTDEYLVFLLRHLIQTHQSGLSHSMKVNAIKPGTKTEIYRRLCVVKNILHSSYRDKLDLSAISNMACLSVPQLIRHFKSVFHVTPHRYLISIRLQHATELLKQTHMPVHEITWQCGFENASAFCRAFKQEYGVQPDRFRRIVYSNNDQGYSDRQ